MCTALFRTSLSAVFHRVSPLRVPRRVLAGTAAWQMQHLEGLIVKCSEWYKSRTHKCHLHCFRLVFEWEAIYCHASFASLAITLPPAFCIGLHPFATYTSINLACRWSFLHRGDVSISCQQSAALPREWRRPRFGERFNLMRILDDRGVVPSRKKGVWMRLPPLEC